MERIATKSKSPLTDSGHDTGNGAGVDVIDFVLPADYERWTIHIVPKDSGGGPAPTDPTVEILYGIGASFYTTNPGSGAVTAVTNKDNVVTRSDQVSKVRLKITNGATVPDGGITAELYGARDVAG